MSSLTIGRIGEYALYLYIIKKIFQKKFYILKSVIKKKAINTFMTFYLFFFFLISRLPLSFSPTFSFWFFCLSTIQFLFYYLCLFNNYQFLLLKFNHLQNVDYHILILFYTCISWYFSCQVVCYFISKYFFLMNNIFLMNSHSYYFLVERKYLYI